MRYIKFADALIQSLLIILAVLSIFATGFTWVAVITVLCWQLCSLLFHFIFSKNLYPSKHRENFSLVLLILIISLPLLLWYGTLILWFLIPSSAWYFFMCLREMKALSHRRLVHLK